MNIDSNKDFFGFTDMNDFLSSLFGAKSVELNFFGAMVATITSFITNYVWDSSAAIYTLWLIMAFDWFTGLSYAIKSKRYWSRKNFRMPIFYIATSLLLALSWHLSKHNMFFYPLPSIAYGGFCAVYFSSWVENLGKLGWIPKPIADAVANRFGLKEILKHNKEMKDLPNK